ncbi:site-specific integrase, partial [Francisellaceae bacterium]|nr:site-specific integrase [Francisellaceae bacterium]
MLSDQYSQIVEQFIDHLWMADGLSQNTLSAYKNDLKKLFEWSEKKKIAIADISKQDLEAYISYRYQQSLSARSTARFISSIRKFFAWCLVMGHVSVDPSLELQLPRLPKSLPKDLSEEDVDRLLAEPSEEDMIEHRDKAMFELLYATGLRVTELILLEMQNINLQ